MVFGVVCLAVGVLFRLWSLGADPSYPYWTGWLTDEGRWTELAREWALFGRPEVDSPLSRSHLVLGPLYHLLLSISFGVLGVGVVPARIVSAVFGLLVLAVAAVFLRRRIGPGPTMATVGILAVHPDLTLFSRVAIPEMPALLLELLAFAVLVAGPRTTGRAFVGGLITAAALGMKGTTAPVVAVFAAVVLLTHDRDDPSTRLSRLTAFLAAIILPALAFLVTVGLATGSVTGLLAAEGGLGDVLALLEFDSLYAIAAVLYEGAWTIRVNLVLGALWVMGVFVLLQRVPRGEARTVFVGALAWLSGWIGVWAVLAYFPERYIMHVHVPLAIALGAGVALLRGRAADMEEAVTGVRSRGARWVVGSTLAVPMAVTVGPWAAAVLMAVGLLVPSLPAHMVIVVGIAVGAGWVLARRWSPRLLVTTCVAWPLATALLWVVAHSAGEVPHRFWDEGAEGALIAWTALLSGSAVLATLAGLADRRGWSLGRVLTVYIGGLTVLAVADSGDRWMHRSRLLEDVEEWLEARYLEDTLIGVRRGTSVLIGTPFRYRELLAVDSVPDVIVSYEPDEPLGGFPGHEQVKEFELAPIPRYYLPTPLLTHIRIYEREADGLLLRTSTRRARDRAVGANPR